MKIIHRLLSTRLHRWALAIGVGLCLGVALSSGRKENLDLPYDAGGESQEEETAPEIIVFYGQEFEGDAVAFSLDMSGSMRGQKWKRLQAEVLRNLDSFRESTEFSLVFFASRVVAFPAQDRVLPATPENKAAARAFLLAVNPGGSTCTLPALVSAVRRAERASHKRRIVIHLSDGWNACPGFGGVDYAEAVLQAVRIENDRPVAVNAVCLGPPSAVNEAWMRRLAQENRGQYRRVIE